MEYATYNKVKEIE